jgi:signal peptidase I
MTKGMAWAGVLALAVAAFLSPLLFNGPGSSGLLVTWVQFLVQPGLWLLAGGTAYLLARRDGLRIGFSLPLIGAAFATGLVQVGIGVGAGAFTHRFGLSPYGHSAVALLLNTWYITAFVVGRELARWYIASRLSARGHAFALTTTWLLFTVLSLSPLAWRDFVQPASAFAYLGVGLFPALGANLFATYLVLRGGPLPSALYGFTLVAFEWYPPLLPSLAWPVQAAIGALVPLLALAMLDSLRPAEADDPVGGYGKPGDVAVSPGQKSTDAPKRRTVDISWIALGLIVLAAVFLNTGAFGYKAVLTDGISMQPTLYAGDVVLTGPVQISQLTPGDVIRFREGNVEVLHRIKSIDFSGSTPIFTTRGDHNPVNDPPVKANAVEGKMLLRIPGVGLPVILVRRLFGTAT